MMVYANFTLDIRQSEHGVWELIKTYMKTNLARSK